jgi:superfamily II DNA or RNA helicase
MMSRVEAHDLRPYQVEAIASVEREWEAGRGKTLLVLATGLGKTTVFSEIVRRHYAQTGRRALVLAHRIELVAQAAARLEATGCAVEIESGDKKASVLGALFGSVAVVATVQTLRGKRLQKWPRDAFSLIVIDEAHRATASLYRDILDRFGEAVVLGVTATPDRGDGVALGGVFDSTAYTMTILDGVRGGYLCDVRSRLIPLDCVSLDSVRTTRQEHGRDLSAEDIAKAMQGLEPLHAIAAPLAGEAGDRKTLVFMPSVETAHALAEVLAGYVGASKVRSLDGSTDPESRAKAIEDYSRGDVQFLVNCALFTEGFDAPATACVAVARPTQSRALYAQMVGRGTRLSPGKTDCLVLDFHPKNTRHDLAHVVDIFDGGELDSVPSRLIAEELAGGATMLEARAKAKERAAEDARKLAERRDRAEREAVQARASYRAIDRSMWTVDSVCGVSAGAYASGVPLARPDQIARLEAMRVPVSARETVRSASEKLADATRRRREGLCTIKQAQTLIRAGLRGDVTFDDARTIMDYLATHGWRPSSDLLARYGAR